MTKPCVMCKQTKDISDFPYVPSKKKHLAKCIECKRAYDRAYWAKTKHKRNERKRYNKTKLHKKKVQFLLAYLQEHPCVVCGESDPLVLEFDHIDPSSKLSEVTALIFGRRSLDCIQKEIDKCQVLCANCHRRKTYKNCDAIRYQLLSAQGP